MELETLSPGELFLGSALNLDWMSLGLVICILEIDHQIVELHLEILELCMSQYESCTIGS